MQRDRALIPVEGLRLAALGILARHGSMTYASLATMVRLFATSYGASPVDVMSSSIELLRLEGLIEIGEHTDDPGNAMVAITARGREELQRLMVTPVKAAGAYAKLLVALKMRFFHLLDEGQKKRLAELLGDALRGERARLANLRQRLADEDAEFLAWLDRDVMRVAEELAWLEERVHDTT